MTGQFKKFVTFINRNDFDNCVLRSGCYELEQRRLHILYAEWYTTMVFNKVLTLESTLIVVTGAVNVNSVPSRFRSGYVYAFNEKDILNV